MNFKQAFSKENYKLGQLKELIWEIRDVDVQEPNNDEGQ